MVSLKSIISTKNVSILLMLQVSQYMGNLCHFPIHFTYILIDWWVYILFYTIWELTQIFSWNIGVRRRFQLLKLPPPPQLYAHREGYRLHVTIITNKKYRLETFIFIINCKEISKQAIKKNTSRMPKHFSLTETFINSNNCSHTICIFCTIICIIFTSLCKNLVKLGPSSIENDAHGIEKLLLKLK